MVIPQVFEIKLDRGRHFRHRRQFRGMDALKIEHIAAQPIPQAMNERHGGSQFGHGQSAPHAGHQPHRVGEGFRRNGLPRRPQGGIHRIFGRNDVFETGGGERHQRLTHHAVNRGQLMFTVIDVHADLRHHLFGGHDSNRQFHQKRIIEQHRAPHDLAELFLCRAQLGGFPLIPQGAEHPDDLAQARLNPRQRLQIGLVAAHEQIQHILGGIEFFGQHFGHLPQRLALKTQEAFAFLRHIQQSTPPFDRITAERLLQRQFLNQGSDEIGGEFDGFMPNMGLIFALQFHAEQAQHAPDHPLRLRQIPVGIPRDGAQQFFERARGDHHRPVNFPVDDLVKHLQQTRNRRHIAAQQQQNLLLHMPQTLEVGLPLRRIQFGNAEVGANEHPAFAQQQLCAQHHTRRRQFGQRLRRPQAINHRQQTGGIDRRTHAEAIQRRPQQPCGFADNGEQFGGIGRLRFEQHQAGHLLFEQYPQGMKIGNRQYRINGFDCLQRFKQQIIAA